MTVDKRAWMELRQELTLFPGPNDASGGPTWVVQDPASQRFFRFDWPAFEMLRRWKMADAGAIAASICKDTTLTVSPEDVVELSGRLHAWELLHVDTPQQRAHWRSRGAHKQGWRWLLNNYLYFRLPLIHPQGWLDRWAPHLNFFFRTWFWAVTLLAGLAGVYLTSQQWERFSATFFAYADWHGALYLMLALALVKALHELGHALTTHHFGCRVPSMGVVFLVLWPVLYTDTSEAWKLRARRHRLAVGAAGIIAELMVACWALLAWHLVPDGLAKTTSFFLSTTALLMSLAFNLNPMMRFDGYFLISDLLDQPNLHERAFKMGRWWLRRHLWGLAEAKPEHMGAQAQRAMVVFAFTVWVYRFIVFFGIALLVYHYFFKTLGIFLMAVEVGVFIVRPLYSECMHWWKQRGEMQGWQRWRTLVIFGLLLAPWLLPWSTSLRLPAIYGAVVERDIQVPEAAQLETLLVRPGEAVQAGQLLARLRSPDLENRLQTVLIEGRMLQWQLAHQGFDSELLILGRSLQRRLEENKAQEISLNNQLHRLTITAPVAGRVAQVQEGLYPGVWLAKDMLLLQLISDEQRSVRAWISEQDVSRLDRQAPARFVPETLQLNTLRCSISRVDEGGTRTLEEAALASNYGGALPVRADQEELILEGAWYKLQLDDCPPLPVSSKLRGTLVVSAQAESAILGLGRRVWAILLRESGHGF